MSDRTIIVGIDEAGYGPLLGPLVVSAAAFEVPAALAGESLWRVLSGSVTTSARPRDRRLPIVDSKKLYQPKDGLARLERTCLAALLAWRDLPTAFDAVLSSIGPARLDGIDHHPWYQPLDAALPLAADAGAVRIAASMLRRDAAAHEVELAGLFCEPLLEGAYNRQVSRTRNKASLLFTLTARLIQRIADRFPDRSLVIHVDRHGGRAHYGRPLMQAFDGRRLVIVHEDEERSAYELRGDATTWHIGFQQEGESKQMPVALASILSKYVRELFMTSFNAFWQRHIPDLRPTAGYYTDGLRFLDDIGPHLPRLGFNVASLRRVQ